MCRTPLATLALLAALTLPASAGTTWIVDAAGGGDFTTIGAGVAAASAGDVLLVLPGSYPAFTLDKSLSVVGQDGAQPTVSGQTVVTASAGATLANLSLQRLLASGCVGKLLLDAVDVIDGSGSHCTTVELIGCKDVAWQDSTIAGKDGDVWCEAPGIIVDGSRVELTDCAVSGGDGWGDLFDGYPGRVGLLVRAGSHVLSSRTAITGGNGGEPDIIFDGTGGDGAPAIQLDESARAVVRGNSASPLQGGYGGAGGFPGNDAVVAVSGFGDLTISGVPVDPPAYGFGIQVTTPAAPQPFLHKSGGSSGGQFLRLNLYGPPGNLVWVAIGLDPAFFGLPGKVEGLVHLDLGTTLLQFPITTNGQELSQNLLFTVPDVPGVEGLAVIMQGFAQGQALAGGSLWLAENQAHLVLR